MLRAAAIGTLEAIGSRGLQPASAGLRAALKQPEATVRQKAAEALGKLRPASPETKAALTQALQDDAPEVQKAASEALLKLAQPPTD